MFVHLGAPSFNAFSEVGQKAWRREKTALNWLPERDDVIRGRTFSPVLKP
jgi:hypothetical protein